MNNHWCPCMFENIDEEAIGFIAYLQMWPGPKWKAIRGCALLGISIKKPLAFITCLQSWPASNENSVFVYVPLTILMKKLLVCMSFFVKLSRTQWKTLLFFYMCENIDEEINRFYIVLQNWQGPNENTNGFDVCCSQIWDPKTGSRKPTTRSGRRFGIAAIRSICLQCVLGLFFENANIGNVVWEA